MLQELHPLAGPFFRSITPSAIPLFSTPWVSELNKSLSFDFDSIHDSVSMLLRYTLPFPWQSLSRTIEPICKEARGAAEQEVLADFEQLVLPECILVQNVRRKELARDSTGKILYRLPGLISYDSLLPFGMERVHTL
jgi:hypothetical protein